MDSNNDLAVPDNNTMNHDDALIARARYAIHNNDWAELWRAITPDDLIDSPVLLEYTSQHLGFAWVLNRIQVRLSHSVYTNSCMLLLPDLQQRDLRGIELFQEDLSYARLHNMDLRQANFARSTLRRADLSNSDLRQANFSHANLSDADLSGANLEEANLSNITYNYKTRWPEGFQPPPPFDFGLL